MTRPDPARSFGSAVDAYDRGRPGYPDEAVDWIVSRARDGRGDSARVRALDLGAGTGKLTVSLAARGLDVTAVEPDAAMLGRLRANLPGVTAVEGTAERIPLADSSLDLVTVAQAWHWVDPERAGDEVARVLVPGGVAALVWNIRDEAVPWVRRLGEVAGSSPAERYETLDPPLGAALERREYAEFAWEDRLDRAALLAMFASRSYVIAMPEVERAQVLAAVGRVLDDHARADGSVWMPYTTRVTLASPTLASPALASPAR